MAKVFSVELKIVGREYPLNDLYRKFHKEGAIHVLGTDKKAKDCYAFLFNDIIVITKKLQTQKVQQYRYKQSFQLQHSTVHSTDGLGIEIRNATTPKNPSLQLLANNAESKKEWLTAIQSVLDEMEKTRVFGVTIEELMQREPEGTEIPTILATLLAHLEKYCIQQPGLFRLSGSSTTINSIISQFDRGIKVDLTKLDNNVVSGILKQFLRSLKEPLIPFDKYDQLLECQDSENPLESLKQLLFELPETNFNILKRLMRLLVKVAAFSNVNKMTPSNLAIVIGPNLPRERVPSPFGEINISTKVAPLVQIMIEKYDEVFPKDPPPRFSRAVPRSATLSASKSLSSSGMMGSRRMKRPGSAVKRGGPPPGPGPRDPSLTASQPPTRPKPPVRPKPPPRRGVSAAFPAFNPNPPVVSPSPPTNNREPEPDSNENAAPSPSPGITFQPESTNRESKSTSNDNVSFTASNECKIPESIVLEGTECCARCKEHIEEEFIELCEKMYHPQCFLCFNCSQELTNGYFKHNGNPVCRDCRRKLKKPAIKN